MEVEGFEGPAAQWPPFAPPDGPPAGYDPERSWPEPIGGPGKPPEGTPARWLPDPLSTDRYRYFNGAQWTGWVHNGVSASVDHLREAAGTAAPSSVVLDHDPWASHAGDPVALSDVASLPASQPTSPRHWRRLSICVVALVAVLVVTLIVVLPGGGRGGNADAAVVRAVVSTLADKTAQLNFNGTFSADGSTTLTMTGTGAMDFTQNAEKMTMDISQLGSMTFDVVGGIVYFDTSGLLGSAFSPLTGGKHWLSMDLSQLTQGGSGAPVPSTSMLSSPTTALKALEQQGNTATDLGPTTVNGVSVEHYSVALNISALEKQLSNMSASERALMQSVLSTAHGTYDIYVDHQRLLRRMTANITAGSSHGLGNVNGTVTMDLSDFGLPVTVSAPPANDVLPFSQIENGLTNGGQIQSSTYTLPPGTTT